MYDKENWEAWHTRHWSDKPTLPYINTSIECKFDPSMTLSGWNTTETDEKKFFERIKSKQASKFRVKRSGSCSMNRKDIRSLLIAKNSPAVQLLANTTKRQQRPSQHRDVLKPRTYLFASNESVDLIEPDLKQIVLPRHILNLSKVVRDIPNDKRSVPFTSFIRSVQEERRKSRRPRQRLPKQLISEFVG